MDTEPTFLNLLFLEIWAMQQPYQQQQQQQ